MVCPRDLGAVDALRHQPPALIAFITRFTFGPFAALSHIYSKISTELPPDLQTTVVESPLSDPHAVVEKFNFDEAHSGRFTVPATEGASLRFEYVMDATNADPAQYVTSNLLLTPVKEVNPRWDARNLVVFSPGLNTLHEFREGEPSTSPTRLVHYANVTGVPMAQIHTGTSFDQGEAEIDTSRSPIFRALMSFLAVVLPDRFKPRVEDDKVYIGSRVLDVLQVVLSQSNVIDFPLKACYRALMEATVGNNARPVVFVTYSRATNEIGAALNKHIEESRKRGEKKEAIEKRLRENVTVLTCGSTFSTYPDGPAYIHMASWGDPLTSALGVNGQRTNGAGKDAVFLNFNAPFADGAPDNHNLGAVTSQFLSLVLEQSASTGFRDLWEKANAGENVIPDNVDRLVVCMISLTRGTQWLWSEEEAFKDVDPDVIPDMETAERELTDAMGEAFVERIKANFDH